MDQGCRLLLHGHDTVQCSYYLSALARAADFFHAVGRAKEEAFQSKQRNGVLTRLGKKEFLVQATGTKSGYPFVLKNSDFAVECGEFNSPNFFVTFRSEALWRDSADLLHEEFLSWARTAGFAPYRSEGLSRVDFCFDYQLPAVDFDEDSFKTRSTKDSQHRQNGKVQTFTFGKGEVVLRVYDKVAEIEEQSHKVWFFVLWGEKEDVWRIEWQVRKPVLRRFDIRTFDDLRTNQGDLLRYLAEEHDTLRLRTEDSNESRWPLHPLWADLLERIKALPHTGILRVYGEPAALEERIRLMAIALYGYSKRLAAVRCVQARRDMMELEEALDELKRVVRGAHEPLAWRFDVAKRIKEVELGQW